MNRLTNSISRLLLFFLLAIIPLISCQSLKADKSKSEIKIKGISLTVEWARTADERIYGLQYRKSLGENEGMIFDYGQESSLSFWMKDTYIPLSIAFIDGYGTIIEIQKMAPNTTISHQSSRKARYALEVNQGWFERNGIKPGDKVDLQAG